MTVLDKVMTRLILSSIIWSKSAEQFILYYIGSLGCSVYILESRHSSQLRWQAVVLVYDYLGTFLQVCLLLVKRGQFQAQPEDFHEQKARKSILYIKKWRYSGPAIPS